jgi:hypothetical protein
MSAATSLPAHDAGYTPWPKLEEPGWHGPAGAYARAADPYTEADPVGVLVSVLAGSGAMIGRGPHVVAGNDRHGAAVWPVLVGDTAKGGKGTAAAVTRAALSVAEPWFWSDGREGRVLGGFQTGHAVVDELRDAEVVGDAGTPDEFRLATGGARDKRALVLEPEYAAMLRLAQKEGSILSTTLRQGWDARRLETRSRRLVVTASNYHLVVLGHITTTELRSALDVTEAFNGYANRFLWVAVRRSKRLPAGGNVPDDLSADYGRRLGAAIRQARQAGRVQRSAPAEDRWAEVYDDLGASPAFQGGREQSIVEAVTGSSLPPDDTPLWRRAVAAWAAARPHPRSELVEALRTLDRQQVEMVSHAGSKFQRPRRTRGVLDASGLRKGHVEVRGGDGDRQLWMLGTIWWVVGPGGVRHGPF